MPESLTQLRKEKARLLAMQRSQRRISRIQRRKERLRSEIRSLKYPRTTRLIKVAGKKFRTIGSELRKTERRGASFSFGRSTARNPFKL
jgi:hypothetical protein